MLVPRAFRLKEKRRESLAAKALRPYHQGRGGGQADPDADRGPNPIAVKRQLQKPGHTDEDGEGNTDPVQELGPDPALQRTAGFAPPVLFPSP